MKKKFWNTKRLLGFCCMGMLTLCVMLSGCRNKKDPDNTSSSTEATTEAEATPTPTEKPDPTPEPTTESTTTTPTPEPPKLLTEDETFAKLIEKIDPNEYTVASNGEYFYEDKSYYCYIISLNGEKLSDVLVDRESGVLYYRNDDGIIADFDKFPPDQTQTVGPSDGTITKEKAVELLTQCSKEDLSLPMELSEYTVLVDDWTTMVNGEECYGVNAFAEVGSKMQLMGMYYVVLDGSAIYTIDAETGEFVLIRE